MIATGGIGEVENPHVLVVDNEAEIRLAAVPVHEWLVAEIIGRRPVGYAAGAH